MNRILHRITALLLASLLLVSSTGIAIDMHYCMGRLKNVTVFSSTTSCMPLALQTSCVSAIGETTSSNATFTKDYRSCCQDTTIHVDTSDDEFSTTHEITISQQQLYVLTAWAYALFLPTYELQITNFNFYRPPPLQKDIVILTQHFLC